MTTKILIIEDAPSFLELYRTKLQMSGFTVLEATDGEEGLKKALTEHPDLILLDLILPKMHGMSVMKRIRQDTWGRDVPIIILTNTSPDTDKTLQTVINNKPAYYLLKDRATPEDVVEKIKEVLKL